MNMPIGESETLKECWQYLTNFMGIVMSETIKINNKLWEYELDREDNCLSLKLIGKKL